MNTQFSEQNSAFVVMRVLSLSDGQVKIFKLLKSEVDSSVVYRVTQEPVVVETEALDYAIAATLLQSGRPVAFFNHTLTNVERRRSAVEKEATAIVEAIWKWNYHLRTRYLTLVTD